VTARTLVEQDGRELVVRIRVEAPGTAGNDAHAAPLLVTRGNVAALTGLRWRALDDAMRRLGVSRLKVGGTPAYETGAALEALRADAARRAPPVALAAAPPATDDEGYRAAVVTLSARRRAR